MTIHQGSYTTAVMVDQAFVGVAEVYARRSRQISQRLSFSNVSTHRCSRPTDVVGIVLGIYGQSDQRAGGETMTMANSPPLFSRALWWGNKHFLP